MNDRCYTCGGLLDRAAGLPMCHRFHRASSSWQERALRAEALVRAKDETIGELLDQSDYWYDLWRRAGNALLACECRR